MPSQTVTTSPPLFVTGLSGAGMSSALKILEDLGYEVFDNFPLSLVDPLLDETATHPVAIGIDSRSRRFDPEGILKKASSLGAQLIFLACDTEVLQRRFTETRRRHPMAGDRPVIDGIAYEQELLKPLRDAADPVIDTTDLSVHDLREVLSGHFRQNNPTLSISLISFGYKNGLPREADLVIDVRFLKNPHWEEHLRPLSGQDEPVGLYIQQDPDYDLFFRQFTAWILPLLPRYQQEGKQYLSIALGCTGGRHRSVFVAETLANWMAEQGYTASIRHRDLK